MKRDHWVVEAARAGLIRPIRPIPPDLTPAEIRQHAELAFVEHMAGRWQSAGYQPMLLHCEQWRAQFRAAFGLNRVKQRRTKSNRS